MKILSQLSLCNLWTDVVFFLYNKLDLKKKKNYLSNIKFKTKVRIITLRIINYTAVGDVYNHLIILRYTHFIKNHVSRLLKIYP